MLWLKFLHIGALAVWVAGLLYLPAMLLAHGHVEDRQDFARIRMSSRFVYMGLVSPTASIAIAAGAALLFVADALHPWMFLKLIGVGVLVLGHLQYGHLLARLADEEAQPPPTQLLLIAGLVLVSTLMILFLVLAKPEIQDDALPRWLTEPGLLTSPDLTSPETPPPVPSARPRSP